MTARVCWSLCLFLYLFIIYFSNNFKEPVPIWSKLPGSLEKYRRLIAQNILLTLNVVDYGGMWSKQFQPLNSCQLIAGKERYRLRQVLHTPISSPNDVSWAGRQDERDETIKVNKDWFCFSPLTIYSSAPSDHWLFPVRECVCIHIKTHTTTVDTSAIDFYKL